MLDAPLGELVVDLVGDVVLGDADLEIFDDLAVDLVGDLPSLPHEGDLVRVLDHPHRRDDVGRQRQLAFRS